MEALKALFRVDHTLKVLFDLQRIVVSGKKINTAIADQLSPGKKDENPFIQC